LPNEYLSAYAFALQASGRGEEAFAPLEQAHNWVMGVAERIDDPGLKDSWLESVPENVDILRAWEGR
jgi:hypothetical protein